mgnify:CR=1 FL=1
MYDHPTRPDGQGIITGNIVEIHADHVVTISNASGTGYRTYILGKRLHFEKPAVTNV